MNKRKDTKCVYIGNVAIGGQEKIVIQSMTNTKTSDIKNTVDQINKLEEIGCELVRVSILDNEDAKAIYEIKQKINIPLVADIHFDYKLALLCIENGIDKIRINPGNIGNEEKISVIANSCKEKKIPIRIGVNSGSLGNNVEVTAENMVNEAIRQIKLLEKHSFYDIIISLKSSNIDLSYNAYKLMSEKVNYPLHLGITEAGSKFSGTIKSSIGLSKIIELGIGDTIRVSLTGNPLNEIPVCKEILKNNKLYSIPNIISCPTCGRIQYEMEPIVSEIESFIQNINSNITIAIMGCGVNGPGESKHADIGIAGGKSEALLFKNGKIIEKVKQDQLIDRLKKEIIKMTKK